MKVKRTYLGVVDFDKIIEEWFTSVYLEEYNEIKDLSLRSLEVTK